MTKKCWKIFVIVLFAFSVLLAMRWLVDGNLLFHTDIARDFYLMKDILENKHLSLIGARAGGLNGWFHGPLWLYLNIPAYVLGHGNPVVIAWYWLVLHMMTCGIVFIVAKKIFDKKTAYTSLLIYSAITILSVHGYINPQGALIVFPIFFYFYWKYKKEGKIFNLILSLFLVGLMIQFQIAFGAPILILTFIDNILMTARDKKVRRFLAYLILLIPLSTYIAFELRHDFLQIRSLKNFGNEGGIDIYEKIKVFPVWFWLGMVGVFVKKKDIAMNLFLFFYIGFWIITLFFNGKVMDYYHIPFLPVLVIVGTYSLFKFNRYLLIAFTFFIVVFSWKRAIEDNLKYSNNVEKQDWSTWNSVKRTANWVLDNCGAGSGYFVYTADLYGYNLRYAMDYQMKERNILLDLNKKRETTCLLMGPNVKENPYGSDNWKSGDVKISGKVIDQIEFNNGIKIEKYKLDKKDVQIEPNPHLINDVFFR